MTLDSSVGISRDSTFCLCVCFRRNVPIFSYYYTKLEEHIWHLVGSVQGFCKISDHL